MRTTISEDAANLICREFFSDFGSRAPIVSEGYLNDGEWREPARLDTESTFRAQCAEWRRAFE